MDHHPLIIIASSHLVKPHSICFHGFWLVKVTCASVSNWMVDRLGQNIQIMIPVSVSMAVRPSGNQLQDGKRVS